MATAANAVDLDSTAEQHGVAVQHPSVAEVDSETHANPVGKHAQSTTQAVRIQARVPPAETVQRTVAPVAVAAVPPLHDNSSLEPVAAPTVIGPVGGYAQTAAQQREQQFKVRTALTKGWRKGKKTRKSVGGGRGPGFTAREVDGLLEVLEEAIPVTREEWEQVRLRHAGRFPGTSRTIDSIRRKFAKVYLARGTTDGNQTPIVRRAKLIRERMAARAVSLEDDEAVMDAQSAVAVVEAMETGEMQEEEDLENTAHVDTGDAGSVPHPDGGVGPAQTVSLEPQPVLVETNMGVMQPIVSEAMTVGHSVSVVQAVAPGGMEVEAAPSPGHGRKHLADKDGVAAEDIVNTMKIYMEQDRHWREQERQWREEDRERRDQEREEQRQWREEDRQRREQEREEQRQWREEERRLRAEEKAEWQARDKESRERETRQNERIEQLLGMLAPKTVDS